MYIRVTENFLNRQRPGPGWQCPAAGHKDLHFHGPCWQEGGRRSPSPANMWKPSLLRQLPRLLCPEKSKYRAEPPPHYVLLPSDSSQAGEDAAQLPGKDEAPPRRRLEHRGVRGAGSCAMAPLPPGIPQLGLEGHVSLEKPTEWVTDGSRSQQFRYEVRVLQGERAC